MGHVTEVDVSVNEILIIWEREGNIRQNIPHHFQVMLGEFKYKKHKT